MRHSSITDMRASSPNRRQSVASTASSTAVSRRGSLKPGYLSQQMAKAAVHRRASLRWVPGASVFTEEPETEPTHKEIGVNTEEVGNALCFSGPADYFCSHVHMPARAALEESREADLWCILKPLEEYLRGTLMHFTTLRSMLLDDEAAARETCQALEQVEWDLITDFVQHERTLLLPHEEWIKAQAEVLRQLQHDIYQECHTGKKESPIPTRKKAADGSPAL